MTSELLWPSKDLGKAEGDSKRPANSSKTLHGGAAAGDPTAAPPLLLHPLA
eukprot:CAMPEP_0171073556 /NCGR_PEP_ID=MMETSP0766_2-20121228/11583_1 /TAXON_ID=439317 /ORGANISM="Gambierdiscus australes, Strain CAWD 149" /LENGTH=50 /DNA_ID=CAMNT_0011530261 /DNA_START=41 /DNA_END=190 /DNA_ORIENTATION=+